MTLKPSIISFGPLPIDKREFTIGDVQEPLTITWPWKSGILYTLLIWDEDAPYPQDPKNSPYLHYLVVDIPQNDIDKGKTLASYIPPNPPEDSAPHSYIIEVYAQPKLLGKLEISKNRTRFNVKEFLNSNKLIMQLEKRFAVNPSILEITAPVRPDILMDFAPTDNLARASSGSTVAGGLPQRGRFSTERGRQIGEESRSKVASKPERLRTGSPRSRDKEPGKPGCGCSAKNIVFQPGTNGQGGGGPTNHVTKRPDTGTQGSPRSASDKRFPITTYYRRNRDNTGKRAALQRSMSPRSVRVPSRNLGPVGARVPTSSFQRGQRRYSQTGQSRTIIRSPSPTRTTSPRRSRGNRGSMSPRSSRGRGNNYKQDIAQSCSKELSEDQMKFYSCAIDVADKNPESCTKEDWGKGKCYNPYSVCAKSVGTTTGRKDVSACLDFENMSVERLRGYAKLHDIQIPARANKRTILARIYDWKATKEQ